MNDKQLYLDMIQRVINRLSHDSFLIKGWSVVLVSAFFALAAGNENIFFVYLAYFPSITLWILDGYFLWQERLFRALYDFARTIKEDAIDYSMSTSRFKKISSWINAIYSRTLLIFHGTIILAIIAIMIFSLLS